MEIGQRIAGLRKQIGITQEELGKAVGVSTQAVSRWECGGSPDIMLLPAIADRLGVSIDALFGREVGQGFDIDELLRDAMRQKPNGERLMAAYRLTWTLIKAISSTGTGAEPMYYDLLTKMEDIDRDANPREMFTPHLAVGMFPDGLIQASVAKDFKYALLMPTPRDGFASILKNTPEYIRLFQILTRSGRLEMLIFIYSRRRRPFTAALAAKELAMPIEQAEEILGELEGHYFLINSDIDMEDGPVATYDLREGCNLIPFLYFAGEMMKESHYGGIGLRTQDDPLLKEKPGEGNAYADWLTGAPNQPDELGPGMSVSAHIYESEGKPNDEG